MDFQIIQFLDHHFFSRKKCLAENTIREFSEEEEKMMSDYRFIITEYIKWEKEAFSKKVAMWEKEASLYQSYTFRRCA